jgi:D-sedoheptulose 7-phosphate isomerase
MPNPASDVTWLRDCLNQYRAALDADVTDSLIQLKTIIADTRTRGGKLIFAGNGASSAIASHAAVDFTKAAAVRAITFHDVDLITCFANDYGYDRWIAQALAAYADDRDVVVLISSSGGSPNVLRAAEYAKGRGLPLVTLSGFSPDNPLRQLGDLSLWVDSRSYNVVESVHQIWLLMVCDLLVGVMEYPATRDVLSSGNTPAAE